MVSNYAEDLSMEMGDIRKFNGVLEDTFNEKMKVYKTVIEEMQNELEKAERYII
jgi:hypothetical protein